MIASAANDAVRLLRAINTYQAHGRVGATVFTFSAARTAGIDPTTKRYEEAVWYLLWEGALTVNECISPELAARVPFGRAPYRFAPAAIRMLEEG
jgi:hypothetical protein